MFGVGVVDCAASNLMFGVVDVAAPDRTEGRS
jgi:hypothetical protein